MTSYPPLVTIAMPCLNEAAFIEDCLASVQSQTYPRDRLEIFVADGGSTDGTLEILQGLAARDTRIRIVPNPERIQSAGLNRILQQSRGEVVVRMDVHCEYALDYVERCVQELERTGAECVGGAQRCRGRSEFERAVCAALSSPLGVGGAAYRHPANEGFVDTVFLGAYRRSVFERLGAWDTSFITNEDAELNQRLVDSGGRIYLSRSIVVHYFPRARFAALAGQYFRYGRGRASTLLKHRRLLRLRPALPFLGVSLGLLLVAALPWLNTASYVLGAATVILAVEAWRSTRGSPLRVTALTALILPLMVVSHGLGFGVGLTRRAVGLAAWSDAAPRGSQGNRQRGA